jgi:hypothetical protein
MDSPEIPKEKVTKKRKQGGKITKIKRPKPRNPNVLKKMEEFINNIKNKVY